MTVVLTAGNEDARSRKVISKEGTVARNGVSGEGEQEGVEKENAEADIARHQGGRSRGQGVGDGGDAKDNQETIKSWRVGNAKVK